MNLTFPRRIAAAPTKWSQLAANLLACRSRVQGPGSSTLPPLPLQRPPRSANSLARLHSLCLEHGYGRRRGQKIDEGLGGFGILGLWADARREDDVGLDLRGQRSGEYGALDGENFADQRERELCLAFDDVRGR